MGEIGNRCCVVTRDEPSFAGFSHRGAHFSALEGRNISNDCGEMRGVCGETTVVRRPSRTTAGAACDQNRWRMPRLTMSWLFVPATPYEPIDASALDTVPSAFSCVPVAFCHAPTRYTSVRFDRL